MKLNEKITCLRKEKGLSQMQVAEKLDLSRQALSRWEQGLSRPSTDNLRALSALYGVSADYLLHDDAERTVPAAEAAPKPPSAELNSSGKRKYLIGVALAVAAAAVIFILAASSGPAEKTYILTGELNIENVQSESFEEFALDW